MAPLRVDRRHGRARRAVARHGARPALPRRRCRRRRRWLPRGAGRRRDRRARAPLFCKKNRSLPAQRGVVAMGRFLSWMCFFDISAHADGERRGRVSIRRCLKTRLSETFPMPPSDPDPVPPRSPSACAEKLSSHLLGLSSREPSDGARRQRRWLYHISMGRTLWHM